MVWNDEFSGSAVDTSQWSHEVNCTGGGNNELQCYTDREENTVVSDGHLTLIARRENLSGPAVSDDDPAYSRADTSAARNYTSARLRSKYKGDWRYGRIEISAQLPQGQGLWPALWMLPSDWRYGSWPASGEIDIMEAVNSNTGTAPNAVHGTLHYGKFWPQNSYTGASITPAGNIWEGFHQYAVEWERGEIRWYVDGIHYATQHPATENSTGWFTYYWAGQETGFTYGDTGAPFDENFHVILNLAVGGNWPGNPDDATQFPQQMSVDYVRVYRCAPDGLVSADGSGCATDVNASVTPIGSHRPAQKTIPLFSDALNTITVNQAGQSYAQALTLNAWSTVSSDVQISQVDEGEHTPLQINFLNAGNSFISVADSPVPGAQAGLKLVSMAQYGELKFDLKILSRNQDTTLKVKIDSGWPNLRERELSLPADNQWVSVSVPFNTMTPNSVESGDVDFDHVSNLFVIEATGPAQVQINNVRIVCLADCSVAPLLAQASPVIASAFSLFDDAVDPVWDLGLLLWETASPHILIDVVDAADAARGQVIDVRFTGVDKNGLIFIQSATTHDLSAFANTGLLSFDINVLDYSGAPALNIKADCVNPCSSGDINIAQPGMGDWQTVVVPISDLVAGGLDLSKVNTPFALLPEWGSQQGVHLQLDNIEWLLP